MDDITMVMESMIKIENEIKEESPDYMCEAGVSLESSPQWPEPVPVAPKESPPATSFGGGVSRAHEVDHFNQRVLAGKGCLNTYDSDRAYHLDKQAPTDGSVVVPNENVESDQVMDESDVLNSSETIILEVQQYEDQNVVADWSSWSPSLLRSNKSAPLMPDRQGESEEHDIPDTVASVSTRVAGISSSSTSVDAGPQNSTQERKRVIKNTYFSRRRPILENPQNVLTEQKKQQLIDTMKKNAEEESKINLLILNEQLEQEKIKTKLLKLDLQEREQRASK